MNSKPTLSSAGVWTPVPAQYISQVNDGAVVDVARLIKLGTSDVYGLVLSGWGYSGTPPSLTAPEQVSMTLLTPDSTGAFKINTSAYITDPVTNGGQSVNIADFNGDGIADIFLAAHNESPFLALPSTAYLSNSQGGYTKVTLSDHVMAHDAELVSIDGKPAIITATFFPGDAAPIYTYSNNAFQETIPLNIASLGGMCSTIVAFGSQGQMVMARGDVMSGWGYKPGTEFAESSNIVIYPFNGTDVSSQTPIQVITPYLSTLPQYKDLASNWGPGITHTYRLWTDDLNHDGNPDILAGESMWNHVTDVGWPSALDILISQGDGTFSEMTPTLNPDMGLDSSEMDYSPSFIDIDKSGINTLFIAGTFSSLSSRQSNYLLINDGTGRLYVALHKQFEQLGPDIHSFIQQQYGDQQKYAISSDTPLKFIGVPQADGAVNFVVETTMALKDNLTDNYWHQSFGFVNVPLQYNPTTDFTQNITISDRNHSTLIRTWAGNDTIYDTNANAAPAHIDGGLGVNTSAYSHNAGTYKVTRISDGGISVTGNGMADTLINIERLQFSDETLALDINGVAGQAYRVYQAAFNRTPDNGGLKFWIGVMDSGTSLQDVAAGFINSAEFQSIYGANPTNEQFVTNLYAYVMHRPLDQAGYDFWVGDLNANRISRIDTLVQFSESAENQLNVIGVIQNGIDLLI